LHESTGSDLETLLALARRMPDLERRHRLPADTVAWFIRGVLAVDPTLTADGLRRVLANVGVPAGAWQRAARQAPAPPTRVYRSRYVEAR
jgi:hypothetical protein